MLIRSLLAFSLLTSSAAFAAQRYPAFGVVLKVQPPRTIVVSCAEIPHFMDAMEMTFAVADPNDLVPLRQGMLIDFTLVANPNGTRAEQIRIHQYTNPDAEPLAVKRMELLSKVLAPDSDKELLAVGQPVPDFALTDQYGHPVKL